MGPKAEAEAEAEARLEAGAEDWARTRSRAGIIVFRREATRPPVAGPSSPSASQRC